MLTLATQSSDDVTLTQALNDGKAHTLVACWSCQFWRVVAHPKRQSNIWTRVKHYNQAV